MKAFGFNDRGALAHNDWCLCVVSYSPTIISVSRQHCSFSVSIDNQQVYCSAVYASVSYLIRRSLWTGLATLKSNFPGP